MATSGQNNGLAGVSYILGWITGRIVFLVAKDKFSKFHAMQSIIFFGGVTVLDIILNLVRLSFLVNIVGLISFVVWIICLIQAFTGKYFKLPYIGDIADRQVK